MRRSATSKFPALLLLSLAPGLSGATPPPPAPAPPDPARLHAEGLRLKKAGTTEALERALPLLEEAAKLASNNSDYVGDYGGTCLELADKHQSYFLAVRGRDNLEKAVQLNPNDLEARDGLLEFYARAPWPLADVEKAQGEAKEITARNPLLGSDTYYRLGHFLEKKGKHDPALAAYRESLRLNSANPQAQDGVNRLQPPPPSAQ